LLNKLTTYTRFVALKASFATGTTKEKKIKFHVVVKLLSKMKWAGQGMGHV
jgi:hypothetical protein